MPDGSWCTQKAKPDVAPLTMNVQRGTFESSTSVDPRLAAAALAFAAEFYRGADPQSADEAIQLALRAYRAMGAA